MNSRQLDPDFSPWITEVTPDNPQDPIWGCTSYERRIGDGNTIEVHATGAYQGLWMWVIWPSLTQIDEGTCVQFSTSGIATFGVTSIQRGETPGPYIVLIQDHEMVKARDGGYKTPAISTVLNGFSKLVVGIGNHENRHDRHVIYFARAASVPEGEVEIKSVKLEPSTLGANDQYGVLLKVTMQVYNGTSTALQTQEPAPGKTYKEGETFQSVGFPESKGKYRIGLDFEGNSGIDHPYRWGLGEPLQPGKTVEVTGFVELKKKSKKDYWAGLVEEQVRWVQDNIGRITVTVTESPARYKLHVTCIGNGGVVVSPYADDYAAGTEVTLGATPFGSARFVEWTGGITTNPLTLTMDSDVDITATFAEDAPQSEIEQRVAALEQGLANMVTELSGYHERADLLDSAIAELKTFKANIKAA